MNTQADIKWISQELEKQQDPAMIRLFKMLLAGKLDEENTARETVQQYTEELLAASNRVRQGKFTTQEDFDQEIQGW